MMRTPRFLATGRAILALALFGTAFAVTEGTLARPACAQAPDALDTNAKINVTVAGETDITGDYIVDASGNITMLYVNQIQVRGMSVAEAQTAITKALKKIYRNPQVLVRLVNLGGIGVSVTGAVTTPGDRLMRSDAHLNDLLQTNAPTAVADLATVEITHGLPGETHSKEVVNYGAYLTSQVAAGNPQLRNGDVIFVRTKEAAPAPLQVSLRGQVNKPGTLLLPAKSTLIDAVQAAGGLTVSADPSSIQLQRSGSTDTSTLDYNKIQLNPADMVINPLLRDGDTIIVRGGERPNVFTIVGGVAHPGEYPMPSGTLSLAEAIGKAGGFDTMAKPAQTTILRRSPDGKSNVLTVNAADLNVQGATMVNVGDNITIPQERPKAPSAFSPLALFGVAVTLFGLFRH